ncbi:MAG TPA: glycosyltransferase, partial [Chloroflexota bacterium]
MASPPPLALGLACVSTFPPRPCGLGTFTQDLVDGLTALQPPAAVVIAAIDAAGERHAYGRLVRLRLEEGDGASYIEAARYLNRMPDVDVVSVQHDFSRFGIWRKAFEEDYLVPMLDALHKPVVVTMHTVPPQPEPLVRQTVQAMAHRAAAIVVMARTAKTLFRRDYGLDQNALARVCFIPHGVPAGASAGLPDGRAVAKRALGLAGHRVLSTFGLINEGKGIEFALDALPALVAKYPDLLYLVIGETHPDVRKLRGEGYREDLIARCRQLAVVEHVRFVNRFLLQDELLSYLAATDVYLTPYLGAGQITSGTLAYALGYGKAIVSTPYLYARELLAGGRGLL